MVLTRPTRRAAPGPGTTEIRRRSGRYASAPNAPDSTGRHRWASMSKRVGADVARLAVAAVALQTGPAHQKPPPHNRGRRAMGGNSSHRAVLKSHRSAEAKASWPSGEPPHDAVFPSTDAGPRPPEIHLRAPTHPLTRTNLDTVEVSIAPTVPATRHDVLRDSRQAVAALARRLMRERPPTRSPHRQDPRFRTRREAVPPTHKVSPPPTTRIASSKNGGAAAAAEAISRLHPSSARAAASGSIQELAVLQLRFTVVKPTLHRARRPRRCSQRAHAAGAFRAVEQSWSRGIPKARNASSWSTRHLLGRSRWGGSHGRRVRRRGRFFPRATS